MKLNKWLKMATGIGAIGVVIGFGWRLYSRRHTLPCPPWLDWLLENPYMDTVAGSETIINRAGLQPGMRLLDVGCGPGRISLPAARRVGPAGLVVALDLQEEMLRRLRQRLEAAGCDNIELIHAGIGTAGLAEEFFDRALLVTVLGEIPEQAAALAEIYEALKPGGILSVTEVIPDPHYQRRDTVRRLAQAAGFLEQDSFGTWLAFTLNFIKPARV
jgi:ubiquinone/menaquinone biosynthesis C-methylase UbiE